MHSQDGDVLLDGEGGQNGSLSTIATTGGGTGKEEEGGVVWHPVLKVFAMLPVFTSAACICVVKTIVFLNTCLSAPICTVSVRSTSQ